MADIFKWSDGLAGGDESALHDDQPGEINAIPEKTYLVGNDKVLIEDALDGYNKKRVSITNFRDPMALYLDGSRRMTGTLSSDGSIVLDGSLTVAKDFNGEVGIAGGSHGSIEIGKAGRSVAGTPFIDFHSAQNSGDYDARIIVSGGNTSGISNQGTMSLSAYQVNISNKASIGADLSVGSINIGSFINMTRLNGWLNYSSSYAQCQYIKDAEGFVHIRGMVKSGTTGHLATLPSGYRPYRIQICAGFSASGACRIDINAAGEIIFGTGYSATWTSLGNIVYRADGS